MKAIGPVTQALWEAIDPIYTQLIQHPFVQQLAMGTLPKACFSHYLSQDILYLRDDSLALAQLAERAENNTDQDFLKRMAEDGIAIEQSLHKEYLPHFQVSESKDKSTAIAQYTAFLQSCVQEQAYPVALAALLPCFWVYHNVGQQIVQYSKAGNIYQKWIETYQGEEFEDYIREFLQITENSAQDIDASLQSQMIGAFAQSTKFELQFFEESIQQANA